MFYEKTFAKEYGGDKAVELIYCDAFAIREELGARLGTNADDPDILALMETCEAIQVQLVLSAYRDDGMDCADFF